MRHTSKRRGEPVGCTHYMRDLEILFISKALNAMPTANDKLFLPLTCFTSNEDISQF